MILKRRLDLSNLYLYGSQTFVCIPEVRRSTKLDPKVIKETLVGYTDTGYKILVNGKVIVSRHVQFIDDTPISPKSLCISKRRKTKSNLNPT